MLSVIAVKLVLGSAAVACYASFIWSLLRFFRQERGMPGRMKLVSATGAIGMAAHLAGIALLATGQPWRFAVSLGSYLAGLGVFWWALRTAWRDRLAVAFSAAAPRRLLRTGPYRFVRHPIYASYALAWMAGAVAIPHVWPWLVVLVMLVQYLIAIAQEERTFLASELGDEYRRYRDETGMMVPRVWKLHRACAGAEKQVVVLALEFTIFLGAGELSRPHPGLLGPGHLSNRSAA